jgi:soluble lytic murein transglycosylase-like protein
MILSTGLGDTAQVTSLLNQAAARYNLPPSLLLSVARTESNLNPNAVSPAGAQGVMQLMPATAAGLGVSDPFDPAQNIDGGAKYLSQLLTQFHGDTSLALAAYNAGPGNVNKYGGIPPFPETQAYVSKVLAGAGDMSTGFYDDSTPSPDVPSSDSSDNSMLLALAVLGGVGLVWALS